ncbi:MAG: CysS/YqeB C-terminal domain-containing protein [Bosea sp. (in: a-proteobacteria)]
MGKKDKPAMIDTILVNALIEARIEARNAKDFAESDRLRAEIVAQGVVLMDAKDPVTGEFSSTWRPLDAEPKAKRERKTEEGAP